MENVMDLSATHAGFLLWMVMLLKYWPQSYAVAKLKSHVCLEILNHTGTAELKKQAVMLKWSLLDFLILPHLYNHKIDSKKKVSNYKEGWAAEKTSFASFTSQLSSCLNWKSQAILTQSNYKRKNGQLCFPSQNETGVYSCPYFWQ